MADLKEFEFCNKYFCFSSSFLRICSDFLSKGFLVDDLNFDQLLKLDHYFVSFSYPPLRRILPMLQSYYLATPILYQKNNDFRNLVGSSIFLLFYLLLFYQLLYKFTI